MHFRTDLEKEAFMVLGPSLENLSSPVFGVLVKNRECHSPVLLVSVATGFALQCDLGQVT